MPVLHLSTDPSLWGVAAVFVGAMLAIVGGTFAMMYAFVRPGN